MLTCNDFGEIYVKPASPASTSRYCSEVCTIILHDLRQMILWPLVLHPEHDCTYASYCLLAGEVQGGRPAFCRGIDQTPPTPTRVPPLRHDRFAVILTSNIVFTASLDLLIHKLTYCGTGSAIFTYQSIDFPSFECLCRIAHVLCVPATISREANSSKGHCKALL